MPLYRQPLANILPSLHRNNPSMDFKAHCLVIQRQHSTPFPGLTHKELDLSCHIRGRPPFPKRAQHRHPNPAVGGRPRTALATSRAISHRGILLGCCFQPETRTRNQQRPWPGRLSLSPCRERARGEDAVQPMCTTWHLLNAAQHAAQHAAACLEFADARACLCSSALCCGLVISKQCICHEILLLWRCAFLLSKSYTVLSPSSPPPSPWRQSKSNDATLKFQRRALYIIRNFLRQSICERHVR